MCFDEVELSDIADALVFKRVFEKVFELGGALVATSNTAPEALYDGGINRAAFAPFAKELERRTRVVSLDASAAVAEPERGLDHRRVNRAGEAARRAPTAGREFGFGEDSRGDDERRQFSDEGASPPPSVAAGARSVLVLTSEAASGGADSWSVGGAVQLLPTAPTSLSLNGSAADGGPPLARRLRLYLANASNATAAGALYGITRSVAIELAESLGIKAKEPNLTRYDLYNADEVFITGTAAEVVPVVKIDGRQIGSGKPGILTKKLIKAYQDLTNSTGEVI